MKEDVLCYLFYVPMFFIIGQVMTVIQVLIGAHEHKSSLMFFIQETITNIKFAVCWPLGIFFILVRWFGLSSHKFLSPGYITWHKFLASKVETLNKDNEN